MSYFVFCRYLYIYVSFDGLFISVEVVRTDLLLVNMWFLFGGVSSWHRLRYFLWHSLGLPYNYFDSLLKCRANRSTLTVGDTVYYARNFEKVGSILVSACPCVRPFVRAHEKTLVEYTWNSVHRLPHTHQPSKFLRFIVNENHNGINLICIFKGNYKR